MERPDEFALIARLFAPLAASHDGALGLTDDCALFAGADGAQWAVTADAMVAGVHFFPDDPPDLIARKLLRVNLSDLAAKGAAPRFVLMTVCFPRDVTADWLERFAAGLKADCQEFSIALIGGDTVSMPGPLTLSLTALGELPAGTAILRANARPGQRIWVSGTIGDGAFGLLAAQGKASGLAAEDRAALLDRYRLPRPRTALGPLLRGIAAAGMDVSDGLVGDLGHICACSRVGAEIEAALLPLSDAATAAVRAGMGQGIVTALTGGDDYELLFTADEQQTEEIVSLSLRLGLRLTPIGRIIEGDVVRVLDAEGRSMLLGRGGYNHFDADSRAL
ncbi:MAG TPA: thiamine-phosphate kinase [Candidatus Sulfotelmatobacter sp.]|jgi:thiamine-monophosphate kinase|nr:thiamine-phosphate kinase [Candidatus Sulfotelmatobacter sp.]